METSWSARLNLIVNVGVVALAIGVLVHPRGPLVPGIAEWNADRSVRKEVTQTWGQLARVDAPPRGEGRLVVMFTDYQCPACRYAEQRLPMLTAEHGFQVVYRHLPLSRLHAQAEAAALAAICAERFDRFDDMHHFLVSSEAWMTEPDWGAISERTGVAAGDSFLACMDSQETVERLAHDRQEARRLGITATPTFVSPRGVQKGLPDDKRLRNLLRG